MTTVVGLKGKDFVIMSAERKASLGEWIAHTEEKKIVRIWRDIWMGASGLSADCQQLSKALEIEARLYELEKGYPPSVKTIATILSQYLYSGRWSFSPFLTHAIIAGKDDEGYHVFVLDEVGSVSEVKYTSVGSGMPFALSVLDAGYREDISKEEAIKLCLDALRVAIKRDNFSGWFVDLLIIDEKGSRLFEKVLAEEIVQKGIPE